MPVLTNIGCLATCPAQGPQGEIGCVRSAALAWEGDTILWRGPQKDLPARLADLETVDAQGCLVIPGLVDCHTHLAFGGWRADEFEARLRGRTYLQIAGEGGGIASTMRATRAASEDRLLDRCLGFAGEMAKLGVTSIECKSGYGLDLANERKLLNVYRRLAEQQPLRIVPTFLGAHVVPPEYRERRGAYVDLLIGEMIPSFAARGLARFCDVFVEDSAFSLEEARQILLAGQQCGLASKLHADQLSDRGGAALAAQVGAVSADHLERVSDEGIRAMAARDVVAVSLPLATLYLGQPPMPARRLIEAGVKVAVATDFNPGSAPSWHLPLAMTLACTTQKMTPAEVLKGATVWAARALRMDRRVGSIEPGKAADFAVIDAPDVNHWLYHFRPNACLAAYARGKRAAPQS